MKKFLLFLLLLTTPVWAGESAYDRIMKTHSLRCGYVVWPPLLNKDPNTGEFSGIFYEHTTKAAEALGLTLDWAEELVPGNYIEALQTGRVDMLCSGDWANDIRGKFLAYGTPIFNVPILAFVREGDTRFDNKKEAINDPAVKISAIDGEMSDLIRQTDFTKATTVSLPQTSDSTLMLANVATGKADITFTDAATGMKFMQTNPGKLRIVPLDPPLRLIPNVLSVKKGNEALRDAFDTQTRKMLQDGTVETILKKYEEFPGSLARVKE